MKPTTRNLQLSTLFALAALASCGSGASGGGASAPADLAYLTNPAVYPMGTPVENTTSATGGAIDSYTIAPALPEGLTFDAATGAISGTPTAITPQATYTVTASNSLGSDTVDLVLRVTDALPAVSYPTTQFSLVGGVAMTPTTPTSTGGAVAAFSVSPLLPAGLTLDAATGEISGTATQVAANWTYTITASNDGGSTTTEVELEVAAPALTVTLQPSSATVANGAETSFSAAATGTGALTYQWLVDGAAIGGATSPTYDLNPRSEDDGASYQLRITDSFGTVVTTEPAQLGVVGGAFVASAQLPAVRGRHASTTLTDGRVLITGGQDAPASGLYQDSLLFDPSASTYAAGNSMSQTRSMHLAVRLADGRVLFTGDETSSPTAAELFDPVTDTFAATAGPQVIGRNKHTATLLSDGRVLLAGGDDGAGAVASAELYDPTTNTFSATGSMVSARHSHTATLLNNGLVLICGGDDAAVSAKVELFDPEFGTFTEIGTMSSARRDHFAVLLGDGLVLVGGGDDGVDVTGSADLFDPTTNTFSATGALVVPRDGAAAQLLGNGRVVLAGGEDSGDLPISVTEVYDPSVGAWFQSGGLVLPRARLAPALLPDGTWLVPGGEITPLSSSMTAESELYDPEIPAPATFRPTNSLTGRSRFGLSLLPDGRALVTGGTLVGVEGMTQSEAYDPKSGQWTATGSLNTARMDAVQVLLPNGKVLVAGGQDTIFSPLATAELYDPATDAWTATASMTAARSETEAVLMGDGTVLVCGGLELASVTDVAEVFDPVTETWSTTADTLTVGRRGHRVIALDNGKVLVIGGLLADSSLIDSCELYDPATGQFELTGTMNEPRAEAMATKLHDGRVLVCGGGDLFSVSSSAEIYDPVAGTWTLLPGSLVVARKGAAAVTMPDGDVMIASGYDSSLQPIVTAEVFDWETETFSLAGNLGAACEDAQAVLLKSTGRVLVVGDTDNGAAALFR